MRPLRTVSRCSTIGMPGRSPMYEVAHHGQGRWNGVAIISRAGIAGVERGFPDDPGFPDAETLEALRRAGEELEDRLEGVREEACEGEARVSSAGDFYAEHVHVFLLSRA